MKYIQVVTCHGPHLRLRVPGLRKVKDGLLVICPQSRRPAYLIASDRSDAEEREGGPIDMVVAVQWRRGYRRISGGMAADSRTNH